MASPLKFCCTRVCAVDKNVSCTPNFLPQALRLLSKPLPILAGRLASIRKLRPFLPYLSPYIAAEAFLPVDGFDIPPK